MDELVYLDTARIGRISPAAHRASTDFLALAAREGGSAYFERFLRSGLTSCPRWIHDSYPGLASWHGIASLKQALRRLAGSRPDLPVLLASRSAALMRLAALLLLQPCRNILVTDLGWPGYHAILEAECRRSSARLTSVKLLTRVQERHVTEDEVVDTFCREYAASRCDGLFLTAVSNLGVRLPVGRIVRRLEASAEVRFVVVDGAQDFCHVSADLRDEYCDLYLAGCQKWLRAYHPMGLAFYGCRRSVGLIETTVSDSTASGEVDDPFLRYATALEAGRTGDFAETINLGPLFSCHGAVTDGCAAPEQQTATLETRLRIMDKIATIAGECGWKPVLPDRGLRSGILLARAEREPTRHTDPAAVRAAFRDRGIGLTAYEGGWIRLSMPDTTLADQEVERLLTAFRLIA